MNASRLAALALTAVLLPTLSFAQQATDAAKAPPPSMSVEQFDQQMATAQENLKKMQEQMTQIQNTSDPAQRQKLMQDHQATMRQSMQTMNGMMGCCGAGMMGGHMKGNGPMMGWKQMGSHYSRMTPEQMKQHQYMMDRYMGMQQMMMEQMMQQQQMSPPAR
ncbi:MULTISPECIES: hypothetical protein [unclassified Pseudomonas]|uniref:hypothetical protein n=1 Tax=unclassified Pseudomonas TaxID=196821 RepID=UPI00087ED06A|nr:MULTISPECIES: hypothetical protein [unclassified Pseudomonas]SCX94680.1 hypothetical protein SAMN03159391_00567 [Pseudomonas sp. NFACC37-1]SFN77618.1 hypothetical protein SAMN03159304_01004 [Pseudomonas sp. NFACC24-1]